MPLSEIVAWDALTLSEAIRTRRVSCVEVMTAYLDHIEAINPLVNAIVALRPRTELLAEAAARDAAEWQGWMHGFPYAVKDLADVAGIPSSYGFFKDAPPAAADSLFVERVRAAGAIFIGKTNTPEFGLGSHTYNNVYGTTFNAYDVWKSAGGSSGGAAVAVATRMLPVADGGDFMGSLRNPPGWANVFGLRPSAGRVPSYGGDLFVAQSGVEGPIARTAGDLSALLRTMAGYDSRAPLSLTSPLEEEPLPGGGRVAWLGDLGGYFPMEPSVLEVTRASLSIFEKLGFAVTTLDDLPSHGTFRGTEDLWPTWQVLRHWLAGFGGKELYADPATRDQLKPEIVYEVEALAGLSAADVLAGSIARSDMYEAFRRLFQTYDYVVLPTAQVMPFEASLTWPRRIGNVEMTSYHRWMEVSVVATLINAPAIALPAGFSDDGLPIGVQAIGPNHADASLLALAQAWERSAPWMQRLPPLLD